MLRKVGETNPAPRSHLFFLFFTLIPLFPARLQKMMTSPDSSFYFVIVKDGILCKSLEKPPHTFVLLGEHQELSQDHQMALQVVRVPQFFLAGEMPSPPMRSCQIEKATLSFHYYFF